MLASLAALAAVLALALPAAGCGDDDGDETTPEVAAPSEQTTDAPSEDEDEPRADRKGEPDRGDEQGDRFEDGDARRPAGGGLSSERLDLVRQLVEELRSGNDPDEIRENVAEIRKRLQELREESPPLGSLTPEQRRERARERDGDDYRYPRGDFGSGRGSGSDTGGN
ncbi:MAG: hypothetical protein ACRDKX_05545 [Solirubrobacterales bacterium]